jgi:hypothetical protein
LNDILDILEILPKFAWPIVVLIIFCYLKDELKTLIDRIRKVKLPGGTEVEIEKQKTLKIESKEQVLLGKTPIELGDSTQIIRSLEEASRNDPIAQSIKPELRNEAKEIVLTFFKNKGLADSPTIIPYLIDRISVLGIAYQYEHTYSIIFGSQLLILKHLNDYPDGLSKEIIKQTFYNPVATTYKKVYDNYPFDNYLNFLELFGLIKIEEKIVKITPFGNGFIGYLTKQRKTFDKLL